MKRCSACQTEKPYDQFYKNKGRSDGLQHRCIDCQKVAYAQWAKENKGKFHFDGRRWNSKLKTVFGITSEQYEEMLTRQDGVCAICGQAETSLYRGKIRRLAVDHDHETGKIRALLCNHCNTGLGKFRDNPDLLDVASQYLKAHNNANSSI